MKGEVEGDEVLNIACTAYNFFPNCQDQESVFSFKFRRYIYIYIPLVSLIKPKLEYL